MTTMVQVAREAGVSTTTVSHVLNGTRHVNAKTVARVRAAIERTGYEPNSIARALAGARTQSLGLAISGITNAYFMDLVGAIEAEAGRRGHTLLLADTGDDPEKELQMVQELVRRRVDGVLLAPSAGAADGALRYLAARSVNVVLIDRVLPLDIDQVSSESVEPTAQLVDHLAGLGHRRIAFVAGLAGLSTTDERVAGYRLGLERNDLPYDPALVTSGASQHEPARAAVHGLLNAAAPPTALVAANNAMTIGALHALRERGLRVPEDIALVAFDDFEWSDLFQPRLTAISQPTTAMGTKAVQLLLARLDDPARSAQHVRLEPQFVHRESCGCDASAVQA